MKILNVLAGGILLSGAIISLQNSANDYGLRTNNLDPNVAAQSDDTSGGGSGGDDTSGNVTADGLIILEQQYLRRKCSKETITSDNEGTLTILGIKLVNYKKNTEYTVFIEDHSCRPDHGTKNMCDTRQQRTVITKIEEGASTSGDKTN